MTDLASRLEPFLILARSTRGAAAAQVVSDATSAPGVYVFAELLDLPNIRDLSSDPNFAKHFSLLQLFAYGTLGNLSASTDSYPPLSPIQLNKLKHLTLVSLASKHRSLRYDQLSSALQSSDVRQLEDLIIDVIYAGLLGGKMHHHEKILHVDWAAGRDVREADLGTMQKGLENWCTTAQTLLEALETEIRSVRQHAHNEAKDLAAYRQHRNIEYAAAAAQLKSASYASNKGDTGGGRVTRSTGLHDDAMATVMGSATAGTPSKPSRGVTQPDDLEATRGSKRPKE